MNAQHTAFIALMTLSLVACRKDEESEPIDLDYTSASDNARAEDAFNDMLAQVDKAVVDYGLRDLCDPTVTFDTTSSPRTITLDFGEVNCTALNGRTRRGRIRVSYTGRYRDIGTVITITPENYHVNDLHIQGAKTVTNLGPDSDGHLQFDVLESGSVTASDGSWTATHAAHRTRTWIQGQDTEMILDDVYLISGSGSGVNRNGVPYTVSISTPLRIALSCPFITQGIVHVIPQGRPDRVIDYGTGTCDGNFSVAVLGHIFGLSIG
ncbi:MAG TPA: hypothetical protein PKN30_03800 [Flavobacteriales bacterium]|nr:hypothetical protein [Flavobacteriales bacterium]